MNLKNRISYLFGFPLMLGILVSCGRLEPKGEIEMKEYKIGDFKGIDAKGKFRVFYVESDLNKVEVESYPNYIKNLDVDVDNDQLKLIENRATKGQEFYTVTVYTKNKTDFLKLADSVEFNVSGEMKVQDLKVAIKDNAKFIGFVRSPKVSLEMSNGSLANFSGVTNRADLKIQDTANIIATYWEVNSLNLNAKNGSYTEISTKDTLKGVVDNTAKLTYYGDPVRAIKIGKDTKVENVEL